VAARVFKTLALQHQGSAYRYFMSNSADADAGRSKTTGTLGWYLPPSGPSFVGPRLVWFFRFEDPFYRLLGLLALSVVSIAFSLGARLLAFFWITALTIDGRANHPQAALFSGLVNPTVCFHRSSIAAAPVLLD